MGISIAADPRSVIILTGEPENVGLFLAVSASQESYGEKGKERREFHD